MKTGGCSLAHFYGTQTISSYQQGALEGHLLCLSGHVGQQGGHCFVPGRLESLVR